MRRGEGGGGVRRGRGEEGGGKGRMRNQESSQNGEKNHSSIGVRII